MVKIRLFKTGAKHKISYRIVAIDSKRKRDGKPLEIIGFFNPKTKPPSFKIKRDRLNYWVSNGAQTTLAVKKLINNEKAS